VILLVEFIMARQHFKDPSISQRNDASCINNKRGMARRAKRKSGKTDRQLLKKALDEIQDQEVQSGSGCDSPAVQEPV
jgi:hypothetical protein